MKQLKYIITILWLGILSSPLLCAADKCPQDSVIGYDQNSTVISKIIYGYDSLGRTINNEQWSMSKDSVLIGTTKTTTEYYPNGKTKSTATWKWSTDIVPHGWIGNERYDYTYDDKGNTTCWTIYSWDTISNDWTNKNKYVYEYENKKQTLAITYTGSGDQWIPKTKSEQKYDAQGHTILDRYYSSYDADNDKWIGSYWYINAYNGNQLTLSEKYGWKDNDWYGTSKVEYGYNAAGKQTYYIYYTWDDTQKVFICTSKSITDYDQWQNTIYSEQYKMQDGKWVGVTKARAEYTGYNSDPIMTATFQWDAAKEVFVGVDSIRVAKDEAGNQILDEQYTWSGNDWAGTKKEEYIYDNNKLILSTIAYKWDVVNKKWDNNTKVLADYNANKMQILDERYQWTIDAELAEGGYWKGTKKDSTVYNAKNVETESFSYQWDDENRRWLGNTKYRKEFDAANNLVLEEQYNWQKVDSMAEGGFWKGIKKEEYAYNAAKQQTLAIIYAWSDAIENWIGDTKKISNYDSNKNQILNEQYTWVKVDSMASGGYWQGTEKATYTFNKNKQQTSSWVYAWNDADTAWVYATRDTASYDSKKNQTLDERYTWDAENGKWVGTLKKEYAYNTSGQQIMFAYYTWDADNAKWIGTQKEEDEQDDEGRTIMKATYTWATDDWQGKTKDTYTYFRNDTVAEHITYTWQTNKWVEKSKTEDSYSADGQHTATATYTWNTSTNTWNGTKKTEWEYTSSGKIGQQTEYTWKSGWVNSTQLINTYTNDQLTAYVKYKWVNNSWQEVEKWEQVDANTERTYEWLGGAWSVTQEKKKEYDDQGRIQTETNQNWQGGVQTAGSKTEYTYTGKNLTQKSSYVYDSGISDWVETDRLTNEYDSSNRLTLTMTQTFSGGVQTKGDKTTNTYNAEGKQINTTTYKWENNDWQYVSKTDSEYSGTTTIVSNWQWDEPSQAWFGTTKEEKEYGTGKDVTITAYEWKDDGWVGTSKTGYTYYPNGKEKSVIDYRWTGSDWVADTKTEYEYSGSKNIVTATYSWENDAWVGQSKIGYYYNEGEDQTTATWDWKDGKWVGNTKMGETFDQFGNRTGQTTYTWNGTDFVYKQKTQTEYGISSKDKTTATYTWNTTNQSWQGVSKSGVTYNGSKISSQTEYKWISGFDWEYTKKTEYEYGTTDKDKTTAIYIWNPTDQSWQGVSKSGETYASNGKIASQFSYTWGGTDWIGVSKTEYEYGSGKNNSVAQYVWGDSTWVGKSKVTENFTDQGDSLSVYTYCWKNDDWSDSLKQEYTYNEYGDKTLYIDAQWNGTEWKNTANSTKWEIEYYDYEKGLTIVDAHYYWKANKGKWYGSGTRYENEYDSVGHKILEMKSTWSSSSWSYSSKQEWAYDQYGNKIFSAYWTRYNNKWKGSTKSEWRYEVINNDTIQVMSASYKFNTNTKIWDWEGISKNEIIFDELGNKTGEISYKWSSTLKDWIGMFKYEYTYDDKGRIVEQINSRYAEPTGWYYDTKTTKVYHPTFGNTATYVYEYSNNEWITQSISEKTYDVDANTKLRTDLYATWSAGLLKSYEDKTYYYHCDPKFTITVNTKEVGVGEVTGDGVYTYYARPSISAVEEPNCTNFNGWDDGDTNATRHIIVTEDKTYTAIFKPIEHTIKASVTGGKGSVTVTLK